MAIFFLNQEAQKIFSDENKLLYRVLPLDRVIEMFEKSRWAFMSPTLWNDPFEKAFLEAEYKNNGKSFFLPIKPQKQSNGDYRYQLFSICLTETRESEAFWKTYAPNGDGVRLTINAANLKAGLDKIKDYQVFIGKAVYQDYETLYSFQKKSKEWEELKKQAINEAHLRLMLKKRMPFAYENEVRILLVRKEPMTKSVAKVKVSTKQDLITGIKLDPRMGTYMARLMKNKFRSDYGFKEEAVRKSRLYAKPNSTIIFQQDIGLE